QACRITWTRAGVRIPDCRLQPLTAPVACFETEACNRLNISIRAEDSLESNAQNRPHLHRCGTESQSDRILQWPWPIQLARDGDPRASLEERYGSHDALSMR